MRSSKLIHLLKHFSLDELKQFRKYIRSPYFNSSKEQSDLFDAIYHYRPRPNKRQGFDSKSFTNENVYERAFKNKKYNEDRLRQLRSYLLDHAKNFITIQHATRDSFQKHLAFMNFHTNHHLLTKFDELIEVAQKELQSKHAKDEVYFYRVLMMERLAHQKRDMEGAKKGTPNNHQPVSIAIDKHYLLTKIKFLIYRINSKEKIDPYFKEVERYLQTIFKKWSFTKEESIHINTWFSLLQLLKNAPKGKRIFQDIQKNLYHHTKVFNRKDIRDICGALQNKVHQIFSDKLQIFNTLFQLYLFQYKHQIFENSHFTHSIYRNIITTSLGLRKTQWTALFLEEKKEAILKFDDGSYFLVQAMLDFANDQYQAVLKYLEKDTEEQTSRLVKYHKIKKLRLRIKVHYELNNFESFLKAIKNFEAYLKRHQEEMAANIYRGNQLFCNLIKSLIQTDKKKLAVLEGKIYQHYHQIVDLEAIYLLEKIEKKYQLNALIRQRQVIKQLLEQKKSPPFVLRQSLEEFVVKLQQKSSIISKNQSKAYSNFIFLLKRNITCDAAENKKTISNNESIKATIYKEVYIVDRLWLLEQVNSGLLR